MSSDETLELSRQKTFNITGKFFNDILDLAKPYVPEDKRKDFIEKAKVITDTFFHDFLNNCKREKPVVEQKEHLEVDWN